MFDVTVYYIFIIRWGCLGT